MKKILKRLLPLLSLCIAMLISCDEEGQVKPTSESDLSEFETDFDFDQFGKTHNAYLDYVRQIADKDDPKARFMYGKTFVDPVFGSFDKGLVWEELKESMPFHLSRVESILSGEYEAKSEKLSRSMTIFLDKLALLVKTAVDQGDSDDEIILQIEALAEEVSQTEVIVIDLEQGVSNDGASMLAICAILKYSLQYWAAFDGGLLPAQGRIMKDGKIKRALADAWGYVSAWVNNGDGSYSWDHESALVNADCVSDQV